MEYREIKQEEDNIKIRKAELEDVMQISEIVVEDWKIAYKGIIDDDYIESMSAEKQYNKELKRYKNYIVATNEYNEILGYAWLQLLNDEVSDCEIVALYTKYSNRRNGIGRKLFKYAMNYFKDMEKKTMIIWCLKDNFEARKFYEKMDGKEFKSSTHKWGEKDYEIISYLYSVE